MNPILSYTVDALVLHSAEASLHRGRRVDDGAAVLIKTIEPGPGRNVRVARLRHEFQLLRQLDVPGVPHALALETFPGGWALILEPAAGESLAGLFAQGPLDVRTALALGVALSAVLAGVHQRGLIHKRLAPQSILC